MATANIETTIPSYYVARPSNSLIQASRQASTREWWDNGCSGLDLVTSLETMDEAAKGDGEMASDRQALLSAVRLLPVTDEVIALAADLVSMGLIPAKAASDAMHIANPFSRDRLRIAVAGAGFELPVMCSPDELLQNNEDD